MASHTGSHAAPVEHEEAAMKDILRVTLLILLALAVSGCAGLETASHKHFMRGQVLDVSDSTAYLCVGTNDGAQVGQELVVYRFERVTRPTTKATAPYFARQEVGKIKITEIVDEHMATAKILSGDIKVNDVAETKR
jgi:hypothetical protein